MERKSRFIGYAKPVCTQQEAVDFIEAIKSRHWDATHNVYAYALREGQIRRYSDDGEPQGSAGQPMLGLFQNREVTDVCCVVTRYFGGVLLGTGGLVRAYSAAARLALEAAGEQRMAAWQNLLLPCSYNLYERVKRLVEEHEGVIEKTDFGADVLISALLRTDRACAFQSALSELSAGAVTAEKLGERFRGVRL